MCGLDMGCNCIASFVLTCRCALDIEILAPSCADRSGISQSCASFVIVTQTGRWDKDGNSSMKYIYITSRKVLVLDVEMLLTLLS